MLRVVLTILAFLSVVAFPTPVSAVVDRADSFDAVENLLMTLPAIAVITLHHIRRRSRTA